MPVEPMPVDQWKMPVPVHSPCFTTKKAEMTNLATTVLTPHNNVWLARIHAIFRVVINSEVDGYDEDALEIIRSNVQQ